VGQVSINSSTNEVFFQYNESAAKQILYEMDGATGVTDFYHTLLRLWQVFSALFAYGTTNSADHPNSSYNQTLHGGLPPENYTPQYPIEWALGLGVVFPLMLGGLLKTRHLESQVEPLKIDYQLDRKRELRPKNDENLTKSNPHALLGDFDDLLNREKVIVKPKVAEPSTPPSLFNQIVSGMETFWRFLGNAASIFWPIWMTTMIMFGTAAMSAIYVMPIMMAVVTSLSILAPIVFNLLRPKNMTKQTELSLAEKLRATQELVQRRYFKDRHTALKERIKGLAKDTALEQALQTYSLFKTKQPTGHRAAYQTGITTDGYLTILKNPSHSHHTAHPAKANTQKPFTPAETQLIKKSALGQYLLGSNVKQHLHRFVSTAMTMLSQIGATFFILWLISSTFGAAALVMPTAMTGFLTGVANLLGGNAIGAAAGFTIASLITIKTFQKESKEKNEYHAQVFQKLSEIYKPNLNKKYSGKTKAQAFNAFQTDIDQLTTRLNAAKKILQSKPNNQLTALDKEILAYDISNVNVLNNDYFFAKQKQATNKTWLSKSLIRLYNWLYGAQSGIFIARMLFLSGGIAASLCFSFGTNPLLVFLGLAALCGIFVGSIRATRYQLNREAQNSKAFFETFDAKLSFMNKVCKELSMLLVNQAPAAIAVAVKTKSPVVAKVKPSPTPSPVTKHRDTTSPYQTPKQHRDVHRLLQDLIPDELIPLIPEEKTANENKTAIPGRAYQITAR
jgi:hypothetical protein